ncbi:hypothetical protein [Pedobacter psychrodurus]|uniref:hypothetical protein n=1 Tax=Pedobacter psychrodurus TaxID=2530456 RepID=UPI0029315B8E|nr:hypothetical protein [Pedobacter psychrodurus]
MKKNILAFILFFVWAAPINAQKHTDNQASKDIWRILLLKINYEKFEKSKKIDQRDSVLSLYKDDVAKLKESPNLYLNFIENELKNKKNQLKKEFLPYKYGHNLHFTHDTGGYYIKKIDLYKVIKYSLFKKGDSLLPENFLEIPVVDKHNYVIKYKPKRGERSSALSYLRKNFSLSKAELEIINDKNNTKSIIEMKKWLDKYGSNNDEKKFIKWAINYLTERPGESVARLNSIYQLIKLQDYKSKDKEPIL